MKANFAELLRSIEDFDLEAYLLDHGFEPLRAKNGEEWVGPCPSCGKTKVAVDLVKRGWHCWICQKYEDYWDTHEHRVKRRPAMGAGGILALVKWLDGLDTADAIAFVAQHAAAGVNLRELPDLRLVESVLDANAAPAIPPPEGWREIDSVLPYMERRGITMEDARCFGLFYCPPGSGRYRNRLIFPVWESGRLIYWQARAMYEEDEWRSSRPGDRFIKALNPERTPGAVVSSEVLMNIEQACQYARVAIVEGPMDCLRTGPDAVCTFGKQMSPAQVRRLLVRGVTAVDLLWDGPKSKEPHGAWPEMFEIAPWLSTFFDVRLVFLPSGDPGDWTRDHLRYFREMGMAAHNISRLATL